MLKDKLIRLMNERDLNVNKLAAHTGMPYSSVSDWVKGKTVPKIDKLMKLAEYFGVTIEELLA